MECTYDSTAFRLTFVFFAMKPTMISEIATCNPLAATRHFRPVPMRAVDTTLDYEGIPQGWRWARIAYQRAGILTRESLDDLDFNRIRWQFEVNALGPLRVTTTLLDNLGEGSKVAIITSRMGSIGDNTSGSRYGYRMSKAAVNIAGVSLAHDLRDRGIAVAILHPGFVRTDMTNHNGNIDPPEAAKGLLARIDELTLETSGGLWHASGVDLLPQGFHQRVN